MDRRGETEDQGIPIPFYIRRDGYDGIEDGVQEEEKSARQVNIRTNQIGDYDLSVRLVGNGGRSSSTTTVNLSNGALLWGDGRSWGDGSTWSAGEFVTERADMGVLGQKFDLEIFDDGAVLGELELNSWAVRGYVEDRV